MAEETPPAPEFLIDLLNARSPSGYEHEAQAVVDRYMEVVGDGYIRDVMGNRVCTVNAGGHPSLLMAGHMDEIGLMVTYIDERGFLYVNQVGGMDRSTIPGRRVDILTKNGVVRGVTGRRALHLQTQEERKKVPEWENLWIDIGAKDEAEAKTKVRIGDVAVYTNSFEMLTGSVAAARAFDNKCGCYIVCETVRRLAERGHELHAEVMALATAQEEIGCRGARVAGNAYHTDFAIAVDVGHATDHPDCDPRKHGSWGLGKGPIITRGGNINPFVFERLVECAEEAKIPYQLEGDPRPTGTDGRELQMGNGGVATGVVSVPLRYMHMPTEVVDLNDVELTVRLLVNFALSLRSEDSGVF